MYAHDLAHATWRKSSRSNGNGNACVEVALVRDAAGVRDTKNRDAGTLVVPATSWSAFVSRIKSAEADLY